MVWYARSRGTAVPKWCGVVSAAFLVMAAAGPAPAWTISAVPAAQAPNGMLVAESCPAPGTCMAVGSSHGPAGRSMALAELWDGSAWKALPTPNPSDGRGSVPTAVSCKSTSACTAVGYYQNQSYQDNPVAIAESWNGTVWTLHPAPVAGAVQSQLDAVSCTGPAACVATGSYDNSTGNQHVPLAEAWNGTAWTVQPAPNPPHAQVSGFSGVSCTGGLACTAVGNAGPLVGLFGVDVPLAEQRPA